MNKEQINQLKWLYSSLAGLCIAYFLALLSSSIDVNDSIFLLISTSIFGLCLPLLTCFALAHIFLIEENVSTEIAKQALSSTWVRRLTERVVFVFPFGIAFLIGHFSWFLMIAVLIVGVASLFLFSKFYKEVKRLSG